MTTLDFNVPYLHIDGTEVPNVTLAKTLSELIGMETNSNNPDKTVKMYGWYKELRKAGILMLDDSDKADLIKLIQNNANYFVFVKGQLLELISKAK